MEEQHWSHWIAQAQQGDEESMEQILQQLEPKIQKSLQQTFFQEREELAQELTLKVMTLVHSFQLKQVPGFWEYIEKEQAKEQQLSGDGEETKE